MNAPASSEAAMPAKLSTLWIFVLINMLFADIFSFMEPGALRQIVAGEAVDGTVVTPLFLLAAAGLTEISIVMVLLSRFLNYRANRWANIFGGLFTIVYVIGLGSNTPHYLFIASIEVICSAWIVWLAWRWRAPESRGRETHSFAVTTGD